MTRTHTHDTVLRELKRIAIACRGKKGCEEEDTCHYARSPKDSLGQLLEITPFRLAAQVLVEFSC